MKTPLLIFYAGMVVTLCPSYTAVFNSNSKFSNCIFAGEVDVANGGVYLYSRILTYFACNCSSYWIRSNRSNISIFCHLSPSLLEFSGHIQISLTHSAIYYLFLYMINCNNENFIWLFRCTWLCKESVSKEYQQK